MSSYSYFFRTLEWPILSRFTEKAFVAIRASDFAYDVSSIVGFDKSLIVLGGSWATIIPWD